MYIIEGNIGVGKSTFLNLLKKYVPEIKILTEPVNNWINQIFGQSLLDNFYKNPKRWAYTLENLAMIYRVKDHLEQQCKKETNVVMERSIYSGHYCFAINGYHNKFFTDIEWNIYNKWANFLLKSCKPPNGFIYLKATPDTCFSRIKKRNRISEKSITLSYVKEIDSWHDKFLIKREGILDNIKQVPVLELDCNQDFIENNSNFTQHVMKIKNFINKTPINLNINKKEIRPNL